MFCVDIQGLLASQGQLNIYTPDFIYVFSEELV